MEYHVYWLLKGYCFEILGDGKYGPFSSQIVDGKMIFTEYWKVLILKFSEMRNTVFFRAKKLMERWYLLGLFELSIIFEDLGNVVFCAMNTFLYGTAKIRSFKEIYFNYALTLIPNYK